MVKLVGAEGDAVRAGRRVAARRASSSNEPGQGRSKRRRRRGHAGRVQGRAGQDARAAGARQEGDEEGSAESAAERGGRRAGRPLRAARGCARTRSSWFPIRSTKAEANPGKWLSKDFFKAERIRTLTVGPEGGAPAGRSRAPRNGASGSSPPAAATSPRAARSRRSTRSARCRSATSRSTRSRKTPEKPVIVVAETFDNLTYTVQDRQAANRARTTW